MVVVRRPPPRNVQHIQSVSPLTPTPCTRRSGRSFNAIDHSSNAADDQGHGTHVAAIVAGG